MKSLEIQNILKSVASRRRNLGSTDEIYQAGRHSHLPEVEKENTSTLPDRVIDLRARSVSAVIRCPKNL
jgi:hypothetical protein